MVVSNTKPTSGKKKKLVLALYNDNRNSSMIGIRASTIVAVGSILFGKSISSSIDSFSGRFGRLLPPTRLGKWNPCNTAALSVEFAP